MRKSNTLQVKNGAIVLPLPLRSRWEKSSVSIRELGSEQIVIERINIQKKTASLKSWKRLAGILKGRENPDPVTWQRKIRQEWERSLP